MKAAPVYSYGENLYLNLTSLCPTECAFCVKGPAGGHFRGSNLALDRPPSVDKVWKSVLARAKKRRYREFVFCGYGESTYRLDAVQELGRRLKKRYPLSLRRLNTIGLGNALWGRDIVSDLAEGIDSVRVSLNTADPAQWLKLHRPRPELRATGFKSVLGFVRSCVASGLDTTVTAVELPGVDLAAVRRLAASLGAAFLPRPRLSVEELIDPPRAG